MPALHPPPPSPAHPSPAPVHLQAVAPGERTEYARNRPRREVGQKARLGETTESLELTHLQEFVGPPGSGTPLAQPFSVVVDCKVGGRG